MQGWQVANVVHMPLNYSISKVASNDFLFQFYLYFINVNITRRYNSGLSMNTFKTHKKLKITIICKKQYQHSYFIVPPILFISKAHLNNHYQYCKLNAKLDKCSSKASVRIEYLKSLAVNNSKQISNFTSGAFAVIVEWTGAASERGPCTVQANR